MDKTEKMDKRNKDNKKEPFEPIRKKAKEGSGRQIERSYLTLRDEKDHLTGLYTREALFRIAQAMIKDHGAGHYIIACVNVDNFKLINEQYGTIAGNKVLQHVAECLREATDKIDGISGRIVIDEFAVLYPAIHVDSEVMTEAYEKALKPACTEQKISIRVGRYLIDKREDSIITIYDRAKIAADAVRGNYEKRIEQYSDFMRAEMLNKQQILSSMDEALKKGQFEMWLQPQYNHVNGAMIGAEALARWNRDGEYVSPAEFIPIFEQYGFIYKMDQYIWEKACRLLRKWKDEGKTPLPLSVNVSRKDILKDDFVSVLIQITKKYQIEPGLLHLEITESAFADLNKEIIAKVTELIQHGFTIEIDDFGSGYSSLNTLKDVPATVLKLDMRFLESTDNKQRAGNIIESVVRMAKWLDMSVIAEGVERKEQADYLKSIGCYYIQGYFYSRPMQVSEYEALMEKAELQHNREDRDKEQYLNNEFWNPESMETLIFNSYVGGACIFEYRNGTTEVIRMNDRYLSQFRGLVKEEDTKQHSLHFSRYLDKENLKILEDTIHKTVETKREAACEIIAAEGKQTEFLYLTIRAIADSGDRTLCYMVVQNITDQRVAEIKEKNAYKQLQTIMDNIQGAIIASKVEDEENITLYFLNDGFYKLYGYTKEQYEAEVGFINDLILPEDRKEAMQMVLKAIRDKTTVQYEYRCRKRDGSIIWVQMKNSMITLDGVDDDVLLGVAYDITDKKQAIDAMGITSPEAMELMQTAFQVGMQSEHNLMYIKDRNFKYVYCNREGMAIVGLNPDENIVGKSDYDLFPKESADKLRRADRKMVEQNIQQMNFIQSFNQAQEKLIYIKIFKFLLKDRNGNVMGIYGVGTDVTEEQENFARMKLLTDSVPGGIATYTFKKGVTHLLYCNDRFCGIMEKEMAEYGQNTAADPLQHIFKEDRKMVEEKFRSMIQGGGSVACVYRIVLPQGGYKWISLRSDVFERNNDSVSFNVLIYDVTEQQEKKLQLDLQKEEYKIAVQHSRRTIYRYNIAERTLVKTASSLKHIDMEDRMENIPYGQVLNGNISSDTAEEYIKFYESIRQGKKDNRVIVKKKLKGGWSWISANATTIFNQSGEPVYAIISYMDITEQQKMEAVYDKWKQSLQQRSDSSYSMYLNRLTNGNEGRIEEVQGNLLHFLPQSLLDKNFDERTREFAENYVCGEGKEEMLSVLNVESLKKRYQEGIRSATFDLQCKLDDNRIHWLKVTLEMVKYPNSNEIQVFLLFEDINVSKLEALQIQSDATTDSLTGALNRKAFLKKLEYLIGTQKKGTLGALMLIDVDNFKTVNDTFGHECGDQVLVDIYASIKGSIRNADLVCRLGGDEFIVYLADLPSREVACRKAEQICNAAQKDFEQNVQISMSIGVAICPEDGNTFTELYRKADKALYTIKRDSKNNFAVYETEME